MSGALAALRIDASSGFKSGMAARKGGWREFKKSTVLRTLSRAMSQNGGARECHANVMDDVPYRPNLHRTNTSLKHRARKRYMKEISPRHVMRARSAWAMYARRVRRP